MCLCSAFQLTTFLFQSVTLKNIAKSIGANQADLSAQHAKTAFLLRIPGVTPTLLIFVVFGTTKPFLKYMRSRLGRYRRGHITIRDDTVNPHSRGSSSEPQSSASAKAPTMTSVVEITSTPTREPVQQVVHMDMMKPLPQKPSMESTMQELEMGYSWEIESMPAKSDIPNWRIALPGRSRSKCSARSLGGSSDEFPDGGDRLSLCPPTAPARASSIGHGPPRKQLLRKCSLTQCPPPSL